jgi:hypothetical protein
MASNSSAQQSEIKAWEEDITPCEHTLLLEQVPPHEVKSTGSSLLCLLFNPSKAELTPPFVCQVLPARNANLPKTSGSV